MVRGGNRDTSISKFISESVVKYVKATRFS
jgi:hypothetical protein